MSHSSSTYELLELVDGGPVDVEALQVIAASLAEVDSSMYAQFDGKGRPTAPCSDNATVDALSKVAQSAQAYQECTNGLLGAITVHASRIAFDHTPFNPWHADYIPDAFSLSPEASTEGLSGTIDESNLSSALKRLNDDSKEDQDLIHVPGLRVVRFPAGHLIRIVRGAPHRSPPNREQRLTSRMLINATVLPIFGKL